MWKDHLVFLPNREQYSRVNSEMVKKQFICNLLLLGRSASQVHAARFVSHPSAYEGTLL